MRIILDTDKKTITVPWNYSDKLEAMNKIIVEATGDDKAKKHSLDTLMKSGNMQWKILTHS